MHSAKDCVLFGLSWHFVYSERSPAGCRRAVSCISHLLDHVLLLSGESRKP